MTRSKLPAPAEFLAPRITSLPPELKFQKAFYPVGGNSDPLRCNKPALQSIVEDIVSKVCKVRLDPDTECKPIDIFQALNPSSKEPRFLLLLDERLDHGLLTDCVKNLQVPGIKSSVFVSGTEGFGPNESFDEMVKSDQVRDSSVAFIHACTARWSEVSKIEYRIRTLHSLCRSGCLPHLKLICLIHPNLGHQFNPTLPFWVNFWGLVSSTPMLDVMVTHHLKVPIDRWYRYLKMDLGSYERYNNYFYKNPRIVHFT